MSMRDLIDERNRREKLKNSIIKGYKMFIMSHRKSLRVKKRKKSEKGSRKLRNGYAPEKPQERPR